jgi:signal transduction histidine kinase
VSHEELVDAFLGLARGDFQVRLPRTGDRDDADTLAYLFNVLAEELGEQFALRRRAQEQAERTVETVNEVLTLVAGGDFEARAPRYFDGSHADALAFLVNATAEELGALFLETERQQQAIEQQAQARLQARISGISTLAAGVAHELNNPLAFVRSNTEFVRAQLLAAQRSGDLSRVAEMIAALDESMVGIDRASRIVGDLKQLSPTEKAHLEPVVLSTAVTSSLAMVRTVTSHRSRLEVSHEDGLVVLGDSARLGQVVLNLVQNAVRAFGDRPREDNLVSVRSYSVGPSEAVVEVRDNGPGMSPEVAERVFDAFFTTRSVGEGSGLGLSISAGLVQAMNGHIELETEPGRGATFRVHLERVSEAVDEAPELPELSLDLSTHRARLLLIDDERLLVRAMKRGLDSAYEVEVEHRGARGLERARTEAFDLVVCDLMLPDLDGMEIHRRLRLERPEVARRMLFLTGGAFTPEAEAFLVEVGSRVLKKPFSMPHLLDRIAQILEEPE